MTKPYMLTASGKHFDLLDPKPEQVDHHDIFAAISKLCRFTGHCSELYTVGHHSLLVMSLVPEEFRFEALMHDAAEAYTGDVGTPMKVALGDTFREIEHRIEATVREKYGLPVKLSPEVKKADIAALGYEKQEIMPPDHEAWPVLENVTVPVLGSVKLWGLDELRAHFAPYEPQSAEAVLHYYFDNLTEGYFK